MRLWRAFFLLGMGIILSGLSLGCSSYSQAWADREGQSIQREKMAVVQAFRREELLDPRKFIHEP